MIGNRDVQQGAYIRGSPCPMGFVARCKWWFLRGFPSQDSTPGPTPGPSQGLVLHEDVLLGFEREGQELGALEILFMHVYRGYSAVVVGPVVIYSLVGIHAR